MNQPGSVVENAASGPDGEATATDEALSNDELLGMSDDQLQARLKELETSEAATLETGTGAETTTTQTGDDTTTTTAAADGHNAQQPKAGDEAGKTPKAGAGPSTATAEEDTPLPVPPEVKAYLEKELPNYKGDLKQIVKSHKEQSGLIGRHGDEIGRLKKEIQARDIPPAPLKPPARAIPDWMPKADQPITDDMVEAAFNEAAEAYGTPEYAKLNRRAIQLDREAERRKEDAAMAEASKQAEAEQAYVRDLLASRDAINAEIPGFYGEDGKPTEAVAKTVIEWGKANRLFTDADLARFNYDPHGGKTLIINAYHAMQREKKRDAEIQAIRDEMNRRLENVGRNITRAARSPQVGGAQTGGGTGRGAGLPSEMTDEQILSMGDKELEAALAAAQTERR